MTSRTLQTLLLARIDCEEQVRERFDEQELAGLAQSLSQIGLQQPILVRTHGQRFVVIDGERRLRAAKLAGWDSISALVEDELPGRPELIQRQLVANCQRSELTPIELAQGIQRLMAELPCTAAEASAKIGLSAPSVSRLLALLDLPSDVQADLQAGRIKASAGYTIARTSDPALRAELTAAARRGELRRDVATRNGRRSARKRAGRKEKPARREPIAIAVDETRSMLLRGEVAHLSELIDLLESVLVRLRSLPACPTADLRTALAGLKTREGG